MTDAKPPRRRGPARPKAFDDASELSAEEVERRVEVRGGGAPPQPPVERAVRAPRVPPPPRERTRGREPLLLIGLVIAGLVALRILLPEGPLTAVSTAQPSGTAAAVVSLTPPTTGPSVTPVVQTPVPLPTASVDPATAEPSLAPTADPTPTPTTKPPATPRPTPRPTPKPTTGVSPAHLMVSVVSTNDGGGSATASSWTVTVTSAGSASPASFAGSSAGTDVTIAAGKSYSVSVSGPAGYSETLTADCSSGTGGLPVAGEADFCTVTKDDIKPKVTVRTVVVNGDSDSADPGEWTVTVHGTVVSPSGSFPGSSSGLVFRFNANQTFWVEQTNAAGAGYELDKTGTCPREVDDQTASPGAVLTCTFTFTYTGPAALSHEPHAWIVPLLVAIGFRGRRPWTTRPRG